MTRYIVAALAGVTFAFTGQPSGLRLLCALAVTNLSLHVWGRLRRQLTNEVEA